MTIWTGTIACCCLLIVQAASPRQLAIAGDPLPGTRSLTQRRPLDVLMVEGIDAFALAEIDKARTLRAANWNYDFSTAASYEQSITGNRRRFASIIGAVDSRDSAKGIEYCSTTIEPSLVASNDLYSIDAVRWPVLDEITAEGLFLQPKGKPIARVVAIPDADWTPEMIAGLGPCDTSFARDLAAAGCEVLVPTLISRDSKFSGNPAIGKATNLTHREFIYRQAFELGRHVIGYEVQKVLAAVDQFELRGRGDVELPIVVVGAGEGGLLAFYSAAIDNRIDVAVVSGYFDQRERVWQEPIYRNVWRLLTEFGDAEIATMIAPRRLFIEPAPGIAPIAGPSQTSRGIAAPGVIVRPELTSVMVELKKVQSHWAKLKPWSGSEVTLLGQPNAAPLNSATIDELVAQVSTAARREIGPAEQVVDQRQQFWPDDRQRRQVEQMVRYTQRLLRNCHREREDRIAQIDRTSTKSWQAASEAYRQSVYEELIGKLPDPTMDPNPRTRKILTDPDYCGYEVVLDVYPDVIASGVLLLPTDLQPGQKRPVVVCQHGLEGTPMSTIGGPDSPGYGSYQAFAARLVKQGFIVYAPQNPYRGQDAFRTLQRKSNPLGRSLFSYITAQHLVTLRWLAGLPNVDPDRIGFYGLSYGGKTAMRVPPLLPPTDSEPGYCLSICSADFNEWVAKNASVDAPFSYLWTGEYEIFEWNMGHLANYAELAMLMAPRPFMVERGHDDGVGIDEWVAWEYAKVRRHYGQLGIGDRTEIEFFDGPHTINGQGTFRFLHRHLNWRAQGE